MDSSSSNPFNNPRPYDILCGRKRSSYNNIGNRRFRITISMNVEKYNSMRSRHERSKFIANLAQTMRYEVGFRFLKKKTQGKGEGELSDEEIRAKIGHALRDLSTNMQQNGGDQAVESKVPRPGPYKRQDKKALRIVSSSSSLETMGTMASAQSTLDGSGAQEEKKKIKPAAAVSAVSAAPVTVQSVLMANIQEEEEEERLDSKKLACAPDQDRSFSPPLQLASKLFQVAEEETTTPLKSNLLVDKNTTCTKAIARDQQDKMKLYPLDVGEACKSLLNPPPLNLIPSLDESDELLDDFWRTSELRNENSALASAMSISSGCDNLSLPSSCCLSDAMETLSLVSSN